MESITIRSGLMASACSYIRSSEVSQSMNRESGIVSEEAVCSHLDLLLALLAAYVEYAEAGHAQHGLQQEGGLAYAGLTAQQDEGALDESAAQHSVELTVEGVDALLAAMLYLAESPHLS